SVRIPFVRSPWSVVRGQLSLLRTTGNGLLTISIKVITGQQLGNADAKIVVKDEHFTAGDETAVDKHIDGVAGELVERADTAAFELEHIFQVHLRAAQLDPQVEIDVFEQLKRRFFARDRRAGEVLELKRGKSGEGRLDGV